MNSVEALVRSTLRVSFRRPRVARYFWLSYLYLAPFAGIDPIIGSPPPDVMLFTPFTGLTSLPALVLGYSTAALPCPLRLLCDAYISGFGLLRLVPTPISIGLRFVFPFGYLHRLHYDSMIGPTLVYPRVPHGAWTYEPHAQGRSLSSTFFSLVLVSLLSSILVLSTASTFALVSLLPSFWVPAFSFSIGYDFFCLPFG